MRPTALLVVLLSASALAAGCAVPDEVDSSATLPVEATVPDSAVLVAPVFAPPEQIGSCVEQIKFGAYTGDAAWTQVWNDVGQTDHGASAYCTQLGMNNPSELALVHEGWVQVEAFLAAAEPEGGAPATEVGTPEPAPVTTERQPEIAPTGPDLNCDDIGRKVWVGSNDYHDLDANDDGWGCDSYG